ncbi:WD repeat-containing protein 82 [Dorcoceras hygrometricum]|uniref:WD repeat-containing protein 82 n=1 Tax=Dorcoceras hygrometricum TaxID=472368 RepID=A0A2Z7CR82_9LAMI|nr:WD repeat-containing protein 82 [Dorcoceras hygrometricum]
MVRVQQMATVEWIQQKRKDKDSADALCVDNQQSKDISSRKHLKPTTGQPAASISLPPADNQTQATAHPVLQRSRRNDNFSSGAKYPVDKETAVARSVVTKNKQQLSEQLLNNLLENIQPFDAINAQDGKNQWLKVAKIQTQR